MPGLLFLCKQTTQSEAHRGGRKLLPTSLEITLLPLQLSFNELEVGNMFDRDVSHYEQELAQLKAISLVAPGAAVLCASLRAFRFRSRGEFLILIHSVRIISAGVQRVVNAGVLPEGPFREVSNGGVTQLIWFLCQGIDRVNRLFSHPEPIS